MILFRYIITELILLVIISGAVSAQSVFSIPDIEGWLDDENYLELRDDKNGNEHVYKVNARTGKSKVYRQTSYLTEVNKALPQGFMVSWRSESTKNYNSNIIKKDGDLYYYSRIKKLFRQITDNTVEEETPVFSPDEKYIAFTRERDLYILDLEKGLETRLTDDATDLIYNGYASWVYYEEILGRKSRYRAFWWSPDSRMIAFLRFDDSPVPEFPIYSSDGVHGRLEVMHYPKAGDPNPGVKLGIIDITTGNTTWIDSNDKEDIYIAWPFWSVDSKRLYYQVLNRDQDDMKIFSANPETGEKKLVYNDKQKAWIEWYEDIYVMKDGSGFILRSDKSGWMNLYYFDPDGKLISRITDVEWRVHGVEMVDEEAGVVYFTGTGGVSTDRYLFRVKLDGTDMKQLTKKPGYHSFDISEKGSYFIDTYSNITTPMRMELCSSSPEKIRDLGNSEVQGNDTEQAGKVELFTIPTKDGFDLPAYWILPAGFDDSKKYGVIFTIYGGPNAGSVRNTYKDPEGDYMTKNGIIRIAVDHRGTGHFGKKGQEYMHRNLGKWEIDDYIAAVKWLKEKPFIDTTKIGITGGSYGGYLTCMALTYGADYFTHGFAKYSVTDWRLYDNVYTERYMDTPEQNPEGYNFGSVMTHAEKCRGKLYIIHGMMDDNVHMQNTIQLIDKLTDLDRDFEMMLYPDERHGWGPPKSQHSSRESREFWLQHFIGVSINE